MCKFKYTRLPTKLCKMLVLEPPGSSKGSQLGSNMSARGDVFRVAFGCLVGLSCLIRIATAVLPNEHLESCHVKSGDLVIICPI